MLINVIVSKLARLIICCVYQILLLYCINADEIQGCQVYFFNTGKARLSKFVMDRILMNKAI